MSQFNVPTREEVNETNQAIFDDLKSKLGFVPNLYATYANSNNALKNYLTFSSAPTSLNNKEKEAVNLAVSQVNDCIYCLSAHTAIAKMNGFSEEDTFELRQGKFTNDQKLNALAQLAKNASETRGKVDKGILDAFFAAGYTKENLIDSLVLVGEKTISNLIHNVTEVPVDFPVAKSLDTILA